MISINPKAIQEYVGEWLVYQYPHQNNDAMKSFAEKIVVRPRLLSRCMQEFDADQKLVLVNIIQSQYVLEKLCQAGDADKLEEFLELFSDENKAQLLASKCPKEYPLLLACRHGDKKMLEVLTAAMPIHVFAKILCEVQPADLYQALHTNTKLKNSDINQIIDRYPLVKIMAYFIHGNWQKVTGGIHRRNLRLSNFADCLAEIEKGSSNFPSTENIKSIIVGPLFGNKSEYVTLREQVESKAKQQGGLEQLIFESQQLRIFLQEIMMNPNISRNWREIADILLEKISQHIPRQFFAASASW